MRGNPFYTGKMAPVLRGCNCGVLEGPALHAKPACLPPVLNCTPTWHPALASCTAESAI
jgi:hypothetical protein